MLFLLVLRLLYSGHAFIYVDCSRPCVGSIQASWFTMKDFLRVIRDQQLQPCTSRIDLDRSILIKSYTYSWGALYIR